VVVRRLAILAALGGLVLSGCSSSSKSSTSGVTTTTAAAKARPQVTIDASEYKFVLPQSIPSGWVDITLHNTGGVEHQIAFIKLGSLSFAAFKSAAATINIKALGDLSGFAGGPNSVDPGHSVTATVHLDPGKYGVACFIPTADGKPHAAQGMVGEVTVAATADSTETAPVADAGTITTKEFTFKVPANFTGQGTVAFTNAGKQVHEAILLKEKPGKTLSEAKQFLLATNPSGPPPFDDVGGITGLGPHNTIYEQLDLTPGKYALLCFYPDTSKGGLPHVLEGMIKEFTIS
jgi:plastocyanin